jgi:hypothetical protein
MFPPQYRGKIIPLAYAALAAAYVLLFWAFEYVPTQDGPNHLANAAALRDFLLPGDQGLEATYFVQHSPLPNWTYYAVAAPLMTFLPPLVAEKIFLSAYVFAFAFAVYKLARAAGVRSWAPAVAALPFAVGLPFHMGFFNYCAGVVVMLAALAYFWPRRDHPGVKEAVAINLAAVAAYFCHLLPALLLLGAVYFLNVILAAGVVPGERSLRRRTLFLVGLLPAWILPLYYLLRPSGGDVTWFPPLELLRLLLSGWPLVSLGSAQRPVGFLAVAAVLFGVAALWWAKRSGRRPRREPRDAFGLLAAAFLVLCFVAPDAAGGGSLVSARLGAFVFIFAFIWVGDGFGKRGDAVALGVAATLAVAAWAGNFYYYKKYDGVLRDLAAADYEFRPGAGMVYLDYMEGRPGVACVTLHAGAYYAVRSRLVDYCNYEAELPYFPVQFRPGPRPCAAEIIGGRCYDAEEWASLVDCVITWDMDEYYRRRLCADRCYELAVDDGRLRIFKIKPAYRKAGRD